MHGVLCFPIVHCGIRQSDLLHVKSQAFEGFLGFCFERHAQLVLSPKTQFISCHGPDVPLNTLIPQKIDSRLTIKGRVFGPVSLTCCAGTIPINRNAPAQHIFL